MFKILDGRKYFYQWDINRKIIVSDETIKEVHFCNRQSECSLVCEVYTENDLNVVDVPNIILQKNYCINVYAYDGEATRHSKTFLVKARSKPEDYVYTETEVKNYESLKAYVEESIKNIDIPEVNITVDEEMSDTSENAVQNKVVKAYVDKNKDIKRITEECYAWELPDGLYLIDNPDTSFGVYLEGSGSYTAYKGFLVIIRLDDFNAVMIYSFVLDEILFKQNIFCVTVDNKQGFEIEDISAGYFASQKWVDERLSALESAFADLTLGE